MTEGKQNKREADLGRDPVGPLLVRLALPTICAQVVNLLYNIVDRVYIGQIPGEGALALTGMGVTFPVITLISAFASLIGMGGSPRASIAMGAGEHEKAERTLGTCTAALWGLAVVLTVLFLLFQEPLLVLFGASADTLPYAMQYLNIYVLGTIFVMTALGLNGFITAQGKSSVAMKTVLIGAVLNCILDPIMIFGLFGFPALGTTGAALATVISQIIAMAIGFAINVHFNHDVRIYIRGFRPDGKILGEIVRIGLPAALQQSLMSVLTVGLNRIMMPFSQTAVSFYGVYYKLQNFLFMPIYGLNNALIPMIGYNFGARNRRRIERITRYALLLALGIMAAGTALFELLPVPLLRLFDASDTMLTIGVPGTRIISISFCFAGVSVILSGCMQGLGRGNESLVVALLRQLAVILPAAAALSRISLSAVWFSFPIAEAAGLLAAVLLHHHVLRQLLGSQPQQMS